MHIRAFVPESISGDLLPQVGPGMMEADMIKPHAYDYCDINVGWR